MVKLFNNKVSHIKINHKNTNLVKSSPPSTTCPPGFSDLATALITDKFGKGKRWYSKGRHDRLKQRFPIIVHWKTITTHRGSPLSTFQRACSKAWRKCNLQMGLYWCTCASAIVRKWTRNIVTLSSGTRNSQKSWSQYFSTWVSDKIVIRCFYHSMLLVLSVISESNLGSNVPNTHLTTWNMNF